MENHFADRWIRKFRILAVSLIFSGALNIGLIAAFIAQHVQENEERFFIPIPRTAENVEEVTNQTLLQKYSRLTFRELCSLLTNHEMVEEGFSKRDLALSILVSVHEFNLDKALASAPVQRRVVSLGQNRIELFPSLNEDQFRAIVQFAYLEKWPLTSRGLFHSLQKSTRPFDPTLVQTFMMTQEFHALQTLFQKTGAPYALDRLTDLVCEGSWQMLDVFVREQSQMLDFSEERRRRLLLSYLAMQSPVAADLLIQTDAHFVVHKLDDKGLLDLLSYAHPTEILQKLCIELVVSNRSDGIHKKSAELLYHMAKEEMPQPFDRSRALARFAPQHNPPSSEIVTKAITCVSKDKSAPPSHRTHIVKEGENLWKIARTYHVSVNELKAFNHLKNEQLKPKMVLNIPLQTNLQGTGSKPPR